MAFWGRSHGLLDDEDRQGRHAAAHIARLVAALEPHLDDALCELLSKLALWATLAERSTGHRRLHHFLSHGTVLGNARATRAFTELKRLHEAHGLSAADLAIEALARLEHQQDEPLVDRARSWTLSVLQAFSPSEPLPPTCELWFSLPREWNTDVSPFAKDAEASIETWLRDIGVIRDERTLQVFHDLAVAEYAGWPCPNADFDELRVIMGFFALWIFHDDNLEGVGANIPETLAYAVRGEVPVDASALHDRYVRGWAELGWSLKTTMSDAWLERHHDRFRDWLTSVTREAEMIQRYQPLNRHPSLDEYFPIRRMTVGLRPTTDFIEYISGVELPQQVALSQGMDEVLDLASDVLSIHNDVFGYTKDAQRSMLNLVSCEIDSGLSAREAFSRLATLHDDKVQRLDQSIRDLLAGVAEEDRAATEGWVQSLQRMLAGFANWHALAQRYSDVHVIPEGVVRIGLRWT